MITDIDVVTRLVLITVLATLIGMEREYRFKPAGVRTNVMVGLGATLMTLASLRALELYPTLVDPTRIAAQIITGIGFIGAGAILRPVGENNRNVVGLTTAATLWVVSGLGIAVGMGFYFESIITTILVYFTFFVLGGLVNAVRRFASRHPAKPIVEDEEAHNGVHVGGNGSHE